MLPNNDLGRLTGHGNEKPLFVDLFAGCGGLSLGLMRAGWNGVFAIEKDRFAFETLRVNLIDGDRSLKYAWPSWLPKQPWEIGQVMEQYGDRLARFSGRIDLLAGGPPCQGFSLAGRRRIDDRRNKAIGHYLEFVRLLKPRLILIENVRGIAVAFGNKRAQKSHNSAISKAFSVQITEELEHLGYKVYTQVVRAVDFGVPQYRPRYFIVGVHADSIDVSRVDDPFGLLHSWRKHFLSAKGLPTTEAVSIRSAISDLETLGKALVTSDDSPKFKQVVYARPITKYQRLMRDGFEGTPNSMRLARHNPSTVARFEKILETCRRGVQLSSRDRAAFGMNKHCTVPLDPQKPCHTLTTLPDDFLHYSEPRILTVREYARIQSFPDWYHFKGKYNTGGDRRAIECPRYTQVGNAVAPLVAECIGEVLKHICLSGYRSLHKRNSGS